MADNINYDREKQIIKERQIKLKFLDKITILCIIIMCLLAEVLFLFTDYNNRKESAMSEANIYGESVASSIRLSLEESINTCETMKVLYLEYGDKFSENFDEICRCISQGNDAIGSMYLAPDAIIQYAYPKEVNEATIGFEMLKDPEQAERAQMAITTKSTTVAGPHALVEGGTGFIIRTPIFNGDKFEAFTIIVLDWDKFVDQVLEKVDNKNSGYNFAVWKNNDTHAVTDEYGFIFKNCNKNISKEIDIAINVPNDVWHLSIEPLSGWDIWERMIPELMVSIILIVFIIGYTIYRIKKTNATIHMIEYDELTGLYTKQAFYHYARRLLAKNPNTSYDIMVLDIENFKLVNSIYGEAKGDEILVYLAKTLKENTPETGLCARIGGDQLVGFAPSQNTRKLEWLKEIMTKVSESAPIPNLVVKYGVYEEVDHEITVAAICDRAIMAVKSIKHNYEIPYAKYDGPVSKKHLQAQLFETKFDNAIKTKEFVVWYQPKFDAKTEKLVSAEALVRWNLKDEGIVSPGEFISAFEEDGLIVKLDEYVFRRVCEDIKNCRDKKLDIIPISVNLSRASLYHEGTVERYRKIAAEVGISTEFVPIELTESATTYNNKLDGLTKDLKVAGFQLHMDDFGSGVSSLASLNILPFDVVKLDKTLIDYIGDPGGDELLKYTIALAHFKKMLVVAEGVETKEQLEFLRKLDCDIIQGYYFSPPKPFEEFVKYLERS